MLRESENVDLACFVINCFVIFAAFGCLWCDEVDGMGNGVRRLVDLESLRNVNKLETDWIMKTYEDFIDL